MSVTASEIIISMTTDPRVHEGTGWMELIANTHPEPTPGMVAAVERAKAASRKHAQDREDSFQRCDTDGFLSQWASGLGSSLERLRAEVLCNGGFAVFPVLYNRQTGERVGGELVETQYGARWKVRGTWYPTTKTKRGKLWQSGFVVLGEWQPCKVFMAGEGYGLSGRAWPAVKPCKMHEREGADLPDPAALAERGFAQATERLANAIA